MRGGTFHPYRRLWATERNDAEPPPVPGKGAMRRSPALCFLKSISGREFDNMDEWAAWLRTP